MQTPTKVRLEGLGRRRFELDVTAGRVSSDGGGVLLREADRRLRLSERLASCFTDHRKPWLIDHTVAELVAQRMLGLALGYEDLNDHEELSKDPLLAALVGKTDPTGERRLQSCGQPLASASTLTRPMNRAHREHLRTGKAARCFADLRYRTLKTWTRARRVIGKAEHLDKGENPRFVVTSLPAHQFEKRYLYEELYCARGEMENRIKEQQRDLFGDRASSHTFRGNAIRSWFSMAAHLLIVTVRQIGLAGTELASAQAEKLRNKILKIGALVSVSVRRIYLRLSSGFPRKRLLVLALERLARPSG